MIELGLVIGIGLVSLLSIYFLLAMDLEGTKGITKPYKSKSGKLRTAKRMRGRHIV